jgi:hypothetical protein
MTVVIAASLALAGCSGDRDERRPPARPRNSAPITLTAPPTKETKACFADLAEQDVRYNPLPDRDYGGGCVVRGAVQLIDYGVPTNNLKAMACPLARNFVAWVRNGVVPAAREMLGSDLVRIDSFGTYACRSIVGGGAASALRLSEHSYANAVDIAAFVLKDGRRITIERDWRSEDADVREFLRVIQRSACKRFVTVLSPEYNAAHYNHLHIDMGGKPLCR